MRVFAVLRERLRRARGRLVVNNVVTGAERSGVAAATATLFRDRLVVLTPLPETADSALSRAEQAWRMCGARLVQMDPLRHDQVFAAVSHLPHALAFALVSMLAVRPDATELFSFAGAGFRDGRITPVQALTPLYEDLQRQTNAAGLSNLSVWPANIRPSVAAATSSAKALPPWVQR